MDNNNVDLNKVLMDLINEGKDDITKLSYKDKEYLTSLIILSRGKSMSSCYITDTPKTFEYANLLASYIMTKKMSSVIDLLKCMIDGAIEKCSDHIIEMLKEANNMKKEMA